MNDLEPAISKDVEIVSRISIVPVILEIICRTTGMGFAAVARVTKDTWVACDVKDDIKFGLKTGGQLKIDTTICHEIRQSGEGVVIDHVSEDEFYSAHHTPATYGFQSYISIPVWRNNGDFFGTLCAIDPNPAVLNTPQIIGMFRTFAQLISFHLNAAEQITGNELKELEAFTATALKEQLITLFGPDELSQKILVRDRRSKQFADSIYQSTEHIKELIDKLNTISGMKYKTSLP